MRRPGVSAVLERGPGWTALDRVLGSDVCRFPESIFAVGNVSNSFLLIINTIRIIACVCRPLSPHIDMRFADVLGNLSVGEMRPFFMRNSNRFALVGMGPFQAVVGISH